MDKQLKRFTFYDLYWKLVKNVNNITAGRIIKNICEYEFCGTQPSQIADDTEAFIWSNIEDVLARVKQLETADKTPKSYNKKMAHFAFLESYYKAIRLMSDDDSGEYLKALCGYMFDGKEPKKLKPPVDIYFDLAKTKLELSKVRIISGCKGGKSEKVKVTDEQIAETTNSPYQGITFEEFMSLHPHIQNDLYASRMHLLNKVDWGYLDIGLDNCKEYKNCTSLYTILTHYKEIVSYAKW